MEYLFKQVFLDDMLDSVGECDLVMIARVRIFCVNLNRSCVTCFCYAGFSYFSVKPSHWLGRCLRNDLFCVSWDVTSQLI